MLCRNFPQSTDYEGRIAPAQEQVAEEIARFDATVLEALRDTETALAPTPAIAD